MLLKGPLLILLGSICFSFSGTFQSFAPSGASPFTITESRMLLGAFGLLIWCLATHRMPQKWSLVRWRYVVLMAISLLAFQLLFFSSILEIGVAVGTVVAIGSTPIWTAIIEIIFFKRAPKKSGIWQLQSP